MVSMLRRKRIRRALILLHECDGPVFTAVARMSSILGSDLDLAAKSALQTSAHPLLMRAFSFLRRHSRSHTHAHTHTHTDTDTHMASDFLCPICGFVRPLCLGYSILLSRYRADCYFRMLQPMLRRVFSRRSQPTHWGPWTLSTL